MVEPETVVYRLWEQIPAYIESLLVVIYLTIGMEWYQHRMSFAILSVSLGFEPYLLLCPSENPVSVGIELFLQIF